MFIKSSSFLSSFILFFLYRSIIIVFYLYWESSCSYSKVLATFGRNANNGHAIYNIFSDVSIR